jgi:hypothetical protein
MEGLLLLAGANLFVVVINAAVCPGLLGVISFQGIVEQFVIDLLDVGVTIIYIELRPGAIHIFGPEFAAVVVGGTLAHHSTDRSFQFKSRPFHSLRQQRPLLLSAKVTQKHF